MGSLSQLAGPAMPMSAPSFKKGKPAFKKRRKIAEAIGKKNPAMPLANKFAIATAQTKKAL